MCPFLLLSFEKHRLGSLGLLLATLLYLLIDIYRTCGGLLRARVYMPCLIVLFGMFLASGRDRCWSWSCFVSVQLYLLLLLL